MDTNLYSPLYTIQDLQKNKLARHSINYKEESWKGVRLIGLGWKYCIIPLLLMCFKKMTTFNSRERQQRSTSQARRMFKNYLKL